MSAKDLSPKERARRLKRIESACKITPEQWDNMKDGVQIIQADMKKLFPPSAPKRGKRKTSIEDKHGLDFMNAVHCAEAGDVSEDMQEAFKDAIRTRDTDFFKTMAAAMEHCKMIRHSIFSRSLSAAQRARIALKKDGAYPTKDAIKKHVIKLHGTKVFAIEDQTRWTEVFAQLPATKKAQGIKPRSRQAQTAKRKK
jgi:hypothetical protein